MTEPRKDLQRHPALSAGGGRLPHAVIVHDDAHLEYSTLFIDGNELLMKEGTRISVEFAPDMLPVVNGMLLASEVEVITHAEMEARLR